VPSVSLLHCSSRTLLRTILTSQINFAFRDMFANFERHIDKHGECKFILAGESGKFNEERISGHLPMSYHLWYGRGAVAYFIFKVFQSLLAEWASVPRFLHIIDNRPSASGNTKTFRSCSL